MSKAQLFEEWWQEPNMGDKSMEDDHQDFWEEVREQVIDTDLTGKKILDFGCNRGGMLRYFYQKWKFKEAVGVDLAAKSIEAANANKGSMPAQYYALDNLSTLDKDFDYATSAAVIYLIQDIADHAKQMFDRLKPGGVYYATHPDYVTDPTYKVTQNEIDAFASVKCATNNLDDIIRAFEMAGFKVYVQRVTPPRYISAAVSAVNTKWYGSATNAINFWYKHRYAFKCVKPAE